MPVKVGDILKDKGLEVIALESTATVDAAVRKMAERNIGAVLITEQGSFVGMFTERDVIKCWDGQGSFSEVPLKDVMSKRIRVVESDNDIEYVMSIMTRERIRHVPVVDNGRIAGMISMRDVVKYHIGNLEAEVHYLKDYMLRS